MLPVQIENYPYHLSLENIIPIANDVLSFHMVGDTGGVLHPESQKRIAIEMQKQILQNNAIKPSFMYHLGDVVYHYGEAEHYNEQFFQTYKNYSCPIFAIAGNHDSDINPNNPRPYKSLDAFHAVFCDTESREISFNEDKQRKSMIQPNRYWTLKTPLAHIIGLHSNVPKYGFIDEDQGEWFVEELKAAAKQQPCKLIIVCIHHAPYSADTNHGSSLPMINFLENAFETSGVFPDIVFSGHVHNYQRFHKEYPNGKVLPFVVNGAGGFDELHPLATTDDPNYSSNEALLDHVYLQSYCDSLHGFLKITLARENEGISLVGEYSALSAEQSNDLTLLKDRFEYLFKKIIIKI